MSRKTETQYTSNQIRENIRNNSPMYDKYAHHRKPDSSVDELIRFVRENQSTRQPTALRLQRLEPLPSIGHSQTRVDKAPYMSNVNVSCSSSEESEADDGLGDSYPDIDDDLDLEIASCTDSFINSDDAIRRNNKNNACDSSKVFIKKTKSTKRGLLERNSRTDLCISDKLGVLKASRSRKLPPLQRGELTSRPSAPAPCGTPEEVESSDEFNIEEDEDIVDLFDYS